MTATATERFIATDPLADLMGSGEMPRRTGPCTAVAAPATRRVTSLSVVVPAKNEALNIGSLLQELDAVLSCLSHVEFEILLIDDGSSDATGDIARAAGARVVRHPQSLGNGAAVKRGIREARGEWILLLDGDGQHPPDAIPALLARAEEHDLVVGSRGGSGGAAHRNIANRIYNGLASYVTNRRIPDLTSGFRVMRADAAKGFVYLLPNTFSYPTTITLAMLRAGYSVAFEPICVRPRQGKSHINLLRDGSRFVLIILRIATFFAPLRVFMPAALFMAGLGIAWYAFTYLTEHRLTNLTSILLTQSTVIFALGLISEQVAALRLDRMERP